MNYVNTHDRGEYDAHYRQANGRVAGAQIEGNWGLDPRQQAILGMVAGYAGDPPVTVTDLGCADGSLLISLHAAGLLKSGRGVDLWEDGVKWGNGYCTERNLPITLINDTIEHYKNRLTTTVSTDVAIIGEVLEHVPDPVACLNVACLVASLTVITVPLSPPPGAKPCDGIEEHVRQYDINKLSADCLSAKLVIDHHELVNVGGWINLVALAKRIGQ